MGMVSQMGQSDTVLIDRGHELLSAIKALGKANSGTLGFLPEGAFDERASCKQIIAAIDSDGHLLGYLLYRVSRNRAAIVHLCVDEDHRRADIGRRLINRLRKEVVHLDGIRLRCRRDYAASQFWPRCGLRVISEIRGRGQDGEKLTIWGEDFPSQGLLFASLDDPSVHPQVQAVLDMNIFLDLNDSRRDNHAESIGLKADWLQDEVSLWLTQEVFTEINRHPDEEVRMSQMAAARQFLGFNAPFENWEPIRLQLSRSVITAESASDESDLRHLAIAIAGGAHFFVTRDTRLLALREQLNKDFNIRVTRPADLIIHLDALLNEPTYAPARFAGSLIKKRSLRTGEEETLVARFLARNDGERKPVFLATLRSALANPAECRVSVIEDSTGPIAAILARRGSSKHQYIELLRMCPNKLGTTLGHSVLLDLITSTVTTGANAICVKDPHVSREFLPGLTEHGFFRNEGLWVKYVIRQVGSAIELANMMSGFSSLPRPIDEIANRVVLELRDSWSSAQPKSSMLRIERSIWPAKIRELALPCFVIPIKTRWAAQLFDSHLASQELFGADPKLSMSGENVYYRSPYARLGLDKPARILWYVCDDDSYAGAASIRACSYVDEVVTDKPKAIYARFKRLGVYDWKDVFEIAGNNLDGSVMAVRFSGTELFDQPISLSEYRKILHEVAQKQPILQSPFPVPESCFFRIYQLGLKCDQTQDASS